MKINYGMYSNLKDTTILLLIILVGITWCAICNYASYGKYHSESWTTLLVSTVAAMFNGAYTIPVSN